jgi:hypothetical protein
MNTLYKTSLILLQHIFSISLYKSMKMALHPLKEEERKAFFKGTFTHFLLRHFCMLLLRFTSPVTILYNLPHLWLPQNQSENITHICSDMNGLDCFTLRTKLIIAYLFSCCFTVVCFTCSVTTLLKVWTIIVEHHTFQYLLTFHTNTLILDMTYHYYIERHFE